MADQTLTKAQWAEIENKLSGAFGAVYLQVDGRRVTLSRQLVTKNRLGICTYVDGGWKGEWIDPDNAHPEQSYLRRDERFAYSAKSRAEFKKYPKRMLKKCNVDPLKKIYFYNLFWPSVTAIRRHYEKTFKSIALRPADGE